MGKYGTNELKSGLKVMIDATPYNILDVEFVKPGKGQAFTKIKVRNLKTGKVIDKTYKSGESIEAADVLDIDMQYLYCDGEYWHFMVPDTFEQHAADVNAMGDAAKWLTEEDVCIVTLYNGNPLSITPPNFVDLEVTDTDPGLKGDTASGGSKPATLSTGAVVKVPLFIQIGEKLKIDTRTGEYVSRVK